MKEEQNINGLPQDWKKIKLGELCEIVSGNTPKGLERVSNKGKYQFYKVSDMNLEGNETSMITSNLHLTEDEIKDLRIKVYPKGTVIFPKRGGAILTNKKRILSQPSSFDLNVMGILPNESVESSYLYYWFQKLDLTKVYDGSNVPQINNKNIAPLEFPLPSVNEQQQIVSKIEELFSELDKGIEEIKTAQQQLKVYRRAVLKWAFENLAEEKTLEEITNDYLIGIVRSNNQQNSQRIGIPYIKMNNVDLAGNIDLKKVVYVEVSDAESKKYSLAKGDILINTRNSIELVGKSGVVKEDVKNVVFNNNLLRIRLRKDYDPLFIGYQLVSPSLLQQMRKGKKSTTNVCALYQRDIFPLRVRVASEIIQKQIVQEIESRLSVCDKIEETITNSLKQAEALRQSILKKAFEGKLA
jgi:type I restriction enzyme, S subunit